jgi:hypothetical protein
MARITPMSTMRIGDFDIEDVEGQFISPISAQKYRSGRRSLGNMFHLSEAMRSNLTSSNPLGTSKILTPLETFKNTWIFSRGLIQTHTLNIKSMSVVILISTHASFLQLLFWLQLPLALMYKTLSVVVRTSLAQLFVSFCS